MLSKKLRRVLYPMMAVAMIAPLGSTAVQPLTASAKRRPRITRRYRRPVRRHRAKHIAFNFSKARKRNHKRVNNKRRTHKVRMHTYKNAHGTMVLVIFGVYQPYSKAQQRVHHAPGYYYMGEEAINRDMITPLLAREWQDTPAHRRQLKRKIARKNRSLRRIPAKRRKSGLQKDKYMVNAHNEAVLPTSSANDIVRIKQHKVQERTVTGRTTISRIARHNDIDPMALRSINPQLNKYSLHQYLKRGTKVFVPNKHITRTRTIHRKKVSFADSLRCNRMLPKAERAAKYWIAYHESGDRYGVWNAYHTCFGKYQLNTGYLHGHRDRNKADRAYQELEANRYVKGRYGTWLRAKRFWQSHHWY